MKRNGQRKSHCKKATRDALLQAFAVTAIYALFGLLWIIIIEVFVARFFGKVSSPDYVSITKGLTFVLSTCVLMFPFAFLMLKKILLTRIDLSKSTTALKEAQRLAHIGSFDYNFDEKILSCSDECLKILGIEKNRFTGLVEQATGKVRPDDIDDVIRYCRNSIMDNKGKEFLCHVFRNGEERSVSVYIMPVEQGDKNPWHLVGTIHDVTEKKRAEEAVKECESIYKTFINSSCDIVYLKDSTYRYIAVNKRMLEYYGVQESDLIGKTTIEIMNNERSILWQQRDAQVLETGEVTIAEETIDDHTFETIIFPVRLANGKNGVGGISRDISIRHQAEAFIKQERDRAQTYLDIAAVIFVALDLDGNVSMINHAGCQILGLERDAIIGKNWVECFVPESSKNNTYEVLNSVNENRLSGYVLHENAILTQSGEERIVEWKNVLLHDKDGNAVGILAAGADITELKSTIDALRESERSKSVLLSNLQGMAYRCRCTPKWTMQFVSQGCYELTGYQSDDLLGNKTLSFDDLILNKYRKMVWEETKRAIREKRSCRYEYEIRTANGQQKWVLDINQAVYDKEGEVTALEGIIIDITESKKQFLQIQYLSDHDHLTGLYNRQYYETMKSILDTPEQYPLTIILADINGLKLINDAFGYNTGDRIIMETAKLLFRCCGEDELLARVGGDEFAILLPRTSFAAAYGKVTTIREAFEAYNRSMTDGMKIISLSIGYSTKLDEAAELSEVEKTADANLSRRKLFDQKSHHNAILASIMTTLYERSFETEEHAQRIAWICKKIGVKMGLAHDELDKLHLLSMLHDIGKVGISDQILKKPDKLNEEEWNEMHKHPEIGYRIAMTSPDFATVAEYILAHHEHWDGTGYPNGLAGKRIPLLARIMAIADAYDAMTQDRIYHKAVAKKTALDEIRKNAGTQFDPDIAEVFLDVMEEDGEEV